LLIPADDEDTLADALVGVLGDEKERERLGRNGRERVEETYTLQVMARRLRESYERVMM
jgi:glycosyltransferase involved in cell wall biosynthesis